MHIAQSEKVHIVRLVRLGVERIPEEDEHIYLVEGYPCGYLLVAALRAAEEFLYLKSRSLRYHFSGRSRSTKGMAAEYAAVGYTELEEQ